MCRTPCLFQVVVQAPLVLSVPVPNTAPQLLTTAVGRSTIERCKCTERSAKRFKCTEQSVQRFKCTERSVQRHGAGGRTGLSAQSGGRSGGRVNCTAVRERRTERTLSVLTSTADGRAAVLHIGGSSGSGGVSNHAAYPEHNMLPIAVLVKGAENNRYNIEMQTPTSKDYNGCLLYTSPSPRD